jgi:hypothetical protein
MTQINAMRQLITTLLPEHQISRIDQQQLIVTLGNQTQLSIWFYRQVAHAQTVVQALQMLHGESGIPQMWAADPHGRITGQPAVIVDAPQGQPLANLAGRLNHDQAYAVGRQLGSMVSRLHLMQYEQHGSLAGAARFDDAQTHLLARFQESGIRLQEAGIASASDINEMYTLLVALSGQVSGPAVLICGDIDPQSVLVERVGKSLQVRQLTSWSSAFGGRPAAEHVRVLDRFGGAEWFSLRVGYGEAYDESAQRPTDQLRESALQAEHIVWAMTKAGAYARRNDRDRAHLHWAQVTRWLTNLENDNPLLTPEDEG